jgi:predicted RNase H-like nuclease
MKQLIVGFDSAWSANNSGAICAATVNTDASIELTLEPITATFIGAQDEIQSRQECVSKTIVFLDQPHIVNNRTGSRPAERIVSSPVGRRYGGTQRSATEVPADRIDMFGPNAPVWNFVDSFCGPANPFEYSKQNVVVYETYPVLYIIANDWLQPDKRSTGRLPKYNPARLKTFQLADWKFICMKAATLANELRIDELSAWLENASAIEKPTKQLQDKLDAAICLLQAIEWHLCEHFLVVGNMDTGYIVTKSNQVLEQEMRVRCGALAKENKDGLNWSAEKWLHRVTKRDASSWQVQHLT